MVVDDEVAALDELDAHLASEERVLEVGGVEHAGREHDDASGRLRPAGATCRSAFEQRRAVVVDGPHPLGAEHGRQHPGHGGAVLEHVGDAARVAQVVLEHAVGAVDVADEVDAGDEAAGAARHRDAERLAAEPVD